MIFKWMHCQATDFVAYIISRYNCWTSGDLDTIFLWFYITVFSLYHLVIAVCFSLLYYISLLFFYYNIYYIMLYYVIFCYFVVLQELFYKITLKIVLFH